MPRFKVDITSLNREIEQSPLVNPKDTNLMSSSEDQKLVKEWKLNHVLYLAGNNFKPSNGIILGYDGKLDIVTYSGEPVVYAVVNNRSDKPKSFWDKLRDSYPEFSLTKEPPINEIFETDICLLFPIAEVSYTYNGPINNVFKFDLNNEEEDFITDKYAEYGTFLLKNCLSEEKNPFEDATIFDFSIIETTNKNFLKTPKDLA
ncbi:30276_t:CDS:2, partial [Racocetra persica]